MLHRALALTLVATLALTNAALSTNVKPKPKPAPLPYVSEPYEARLPESAPAPRATPQHNDVRDSANGA